MQSKLQAIAAVMWQTAQKTGKTGQRLDSERAIACYIQGTIHQLRLGRQGAFPTSREVDICRVAFGVPATAETQIYITGNAWHVCQLTWEQTS